MAETEINRIHARVKGRVQGVGFRYFTQQTAQDLGLTGWVRNCPDGSVELEAQGEADVLRLFRAKLERGPAFGRVDDLKVADRAAKADERSFRITF